MRTSCRGIVTETNRAILGSNSAAQATGYPNGARSRIGGITGGLDCEEAPFTDCEVLVSVPTSWQDVTFRFLGNVGTTWTELDVATLRDLQHAQRGRRQLSGLLFEWHGEAYDEFAIEAYQTDVDHQDPIEVAVRAWGCNTAYRPQRLRKLQQTITIAGGPGAVVAFAGSQNTRINLTALSATHNSLAGAPLLVELARVPVLGPTVVVWRVYVSAAGLVQAWASPPLGDSSLELQPGEGLEVAASPGALESVVINLQGYEA